MVFISKVSCHPPFPAQVVSLDPLKGEAERIDEAFQLEAVEEPWANQHVQLLPLKLPESADWGDYVQYNDPSAATPELVALLETCAAHIQVK